MRARSAGRGPGAAHIGVPFSYYHDKNGVYRAYAQPDDKYSPVKITRRDNEVTLDVYVKLEGQYTQKFGPKETTTYADAIIKGIQDKWGNETVKDPNGQDAYTVKTNIHCNSQHGDLSKTRYSKDPKQQEFIITADNFSKSPDFGLTSHVSMIDNKYLENVTSSLYDFQQLHPEKAFDRLKNDREKWFEEFKQNPGDKLAKAGDFLSKAGELGIDVAAGLAQVVPNIPDIVTLKPNGVPSFDLEKIGLNQKGNDVGNVTMYNREGNRKYTEEEYADVVGHELGHIMRIGDPYKGPFRLMMAAPSTYTTTNSDGFRTTVNIPNDDLMVGSYWNQDIKLSPTNVDMILEGDKTKQTQFYDKDWKTAPNTGIVGALGKIKPKVEDFYNEYTDKVPQEQRSPGTFMKTLLEYAWDNYIK